MPCYDPRDALHDTREQHKKEMDKLTRLLCEACNHLEALQHTMNGELKEWWQKHKEFDRRRGARK